MNKNKIRLFVACVALLALLSACGSTAGGQNESTESINTEGSSTQLQENQVNTTISQATQESSTDKQETMENTEETKPFNVDADVITDKADVKEEPKKNFLETIVDTVTGWFDGNNAEEEKNPTTSDHPSTDATEQTPGESTETTAPSEGVLTYEEYLALSAAERMDYYNSFGDPEAFTLWFQAAKEAYNNGTSIEIGNGPIELIP